MTLPDLALVAGLPVIPSCVCRWRSLSLDPSVGRAGFDLGGVASSVTPRPGRVNQCIAIKQGSNWNPIGSVAAPVSIALTSEV